jgi:hypothetical protein
VSSRRLAGVAGALCLALAAGGCGSKPRDPPCPKVFMVDETSQLTRFRPGPGRDLTDVQFEAEVTGYTGSCEYADRKLTIQINVAFAVTRGPANENRQAKFEYFVAVPKLFPSPAGKRIFDVALQFPQNQRRAQFEDEIELDVPIANKAAGPSNEVYIGLQLSPEELEFNRKRRER